MGIELGGLGSLQNQISGFLSAKRKESERTARELSSGQRDFASDPASLAMAGRLDSQIRALSQALRSADSARGLVETAAGAVSSATDSIARLKELTLQFNNTADSTDQGIIREQIQSELANIEGALGTSYDGTKPLQTSTQTEIVVGEGTGDTILMSPQNLTLSSLGFEGFDPASSVALATLDAAANQLQQASGSLGSLESRLDHVESGLENRISSAAAAFSSLADVDVAEALARKTRDDIQTRQSVAILAQANRGTSHFIDLLKGSSKS